MKTTIKNNLMQNAQSAAQHAEWHWDAGSAYHNFLQIFCLQMMQWLEEILFDVVVEWVFDIGHLP